MEKDEIASTDAKGFCARGSVWVEFEDRDDFGFSCGGVGGEGREGVVPGDAGGTLLCVCGLDYGHAGFVFSFPADEITWPKTG